MKFSDALIATLREEALKASKQAYAPYSKLHVGAALLANDGNIYRGANIENASYGLTLCAERAAVAAALQTVTQDRENMVEAIYIVNTKLPAIPPCGACRQVLYEFGHSGIIFFDGQDGVKKSSIEKLLPEAFRL